MAALASGLFFHMDYRQRFAVYQGDGDGFHGDIALCTEELCPSQRCPHLEACKPSGPRRIFTSLQNHAADSAARPIRMDEESANLCRIAKGVQQRIFAPRPMIAPVKRLALAPATATDDHQFVSRVLYFSALGKDRFGFRHDIRSVGDELTIDAENGFERAFNLRRSVLLGLQSAHGRLDQSTQNGNIFWNSEAEANVRLSHRSKAG